MTSNFERVRDDFLQSLPPAERRLFASLPSSGQLLDEVRQWNVIQKHRFKAVRMLSNIKKFSDGMEPYFAIIGLFVSSHPQFAALTWGGLRLVLKVGLPSSMTITLIHSGIVSKQFLGVLREAHRRSWAFEHGAPCVWAICESAGK